MKSLTGIDGQTDAVADDWSGEAEPCTWSGTVVGELLMHQTVRPRVRLTSLHRAGDHIF